MPARKRTVEARTERLPARPHRSRATLKGVSAFKLMSLLLAAVGAASPAAPSGAPVLWLGPFDTGSVDGPALLEAVAVYTRDLNLETRTASDIPLPAAAARAAGRDATAGAALRAHGARLGFWCEPAPDGKRPAHHRRPRRAARGAPGRGTRGRQRRAQSRDRAQAARGAGGDDRSRGRRGEAVCSSRAPRLRPRPSRLSPRRPSLCPAPAAPPSPPPPPARRCGGRARLRPPPHRRSSA